MKKNYIKITRRTHYLSAVRNDDGKPFELPKGVLAKGTTGCGGTTLALEDEYPTVIASPRKALIECKARQYADALLVEGGVKTDDVAMYVVHCEEKGIVPKILTTYDSLFKVTRAIGDMTDWRVVVDEFQCMLSDSTFKSDIEIKMIQQLKAFPYVTFMSATPILDEFLSEIEVFKDVPFTQLVWEDAEKVEVIRHKTNNPVAAAMKMVREYQEGRFPMKEVDGKMMESREAVFFLNSVQNICNIINTCGLNAGEVNIIVGDNDENDKMLSKLGEGFENGSAPIRGEKHKMFTFCTSTAYMGVDFYSTNATTFVISDCKRVNTAVDIITELPQIAGRQRLQENVFRNVIHLFFNTGIEDVDEKAFIAELDKKLKVSEELIDVYNKAEGDARKNLAKKLKREQKMMKYSETFDYYDEAQDRFCINRMAYLSEIYSFKVQKEMYRNGLTVRRLTNSSPLLESNGSQVYDVFNEHVENVIMRTTFEEKMHKYLEYKTASNAHFNLLIPYMEQQTPELRYYYEELGAERIQALGCKEANLRNEIYKRKMNEEVKRRLCERLMTGCYRMYTTDELKDTLNSIYHDLNIKAKATVPKYENEYGFILKPHKKMMLNGRKNVYEIVKKPLDIVFNPGKQG